MKRRGNPNPRYLRHEQIAGFSQESVSALRVVVVGAGAIGNELIKNLVLLGVGHISIYDLDRVEIHNLTRSVLLREADIGHDKAHSVAARARELDPTVRIDAHRGDIHDILRIEQVRDADIVFGCTDNFEARIRINQLCLLTATPWINTAIDARYGTTELFPFDTPGAHDAVACYECTLPAGVYERLAQRQSCGGLLRAAMARQVMPTTTITTSVTAALACNEALRHTGCDSRAPLTDNAAGSIRIFTDTLTGLSTRSAVPCADLCAGCGLTPRAPTSIGSVSSGDGLLALPGISEETVLLLSDRLVWSCACETCGPQTNTTAFSGQRAATLTDAITVCARCGQNSVKVDIREQFTAGELATHFGSRPLPIAWALLENGLIEFTSPTDDGK